MVGFSQSQEANGWLQPAVLIPNNGCGAWAVVLNQYLPTNSPTES
jgi:hypothetical protein